MIDPPDPLTSPEKPGPRSIPGTKWARFTTEENAILEGIFARWPGSSAGQIQLAFLDATGRTICKSVIGKRRLCWNIKKAEAEASESEGGGS